MPELDEHGNSESISLPARILEHRVVLVHGGGRCGGRRRRFLNLRPSGVNTAVRYDGCGRNHPPRVVSSDLLGLAVVSERLMDLAVNGRC